MYGIATTHPIGRATYATRDLAVAFAVVWGFGPHRVYLNLRKSKGGPGAPVADGS